MYYPFVRKALFQLDPERAHEFTFQQLRRITGTPLAALVRQNVPEKPVQCMGLTFKNPLGLAAGLDKNGECIDALGAMGFGSIEIGTVTPRPQPGNDKPRLFRLVEAEGLINRMGFNNLGVDHLVENVKKAHFDGILGINIGKNFDTPIENATDDYLLCLEKVYPYADYVTVNISSPNTKNLRQLQQADALEQLLSALKQRQQALAQEHGEYVPLVLKIAPDLDVEQIQAIADLLTRYAFDGVVATNTTLSRDGVEHLPHADEAGGLSGAPVRAKSTAVVRALAERLEGKIPIIGVGGIVDGIAGAEKMAAGAQLVQLYSGLIYRGPALINEVLQHLTPQKVK